MQSSVFRLKALLALGAVVCLPLAAHATAYGSLNNFDVVNDTGGPCYGFEIELEDLESTDITYTYDYNHYGAPEITTDRSDPAHPRTYVRYRGKRNPDGSWSGFTNPQDPLNPLAATDGHAFTNPGVNLGGEHFGLGYRRAPSLVRYHWLVEDPLQPGTLTLGPAVNIATPTFNYVPPAAPGAPAVVRVVVAPPAPEPPEVEPPVPQFGVPVWVKVFTTVQPSGHKIRLEELLPLDEVKDPKGVAPWQGEVEEPETEIEWMVFQKRPPGDPDGEGEIEGADELPEGDETVTRRYEFYEYLGPTNPEDGEAQCDNPADCDGAVGQFLGAQMAGFNVETPLGLINHVQNGEIEMPYVDRTLVVGGTPPYLVGLASGALPDGLELDPVEGVLSGTPLVAGSFTFTVEVTDSDAVTVQQAYTLLIVDPLGIKTSELPSATELTLYSATLQASGGTPPYTWTAAGLPSGLLLGNDGLLSGTPDIGTAGLHTVFVTVTDAAEASVSVSLDLWVDPAPIPAGDVNGDRVVDTTDVVLILAARGQPAVGPEDPRDLDRDGKITALDARKCVLLFTPR